MAGLGLLSKGGALLGKGVSRLKDVDKLAAAKKTAGLTADTVMGFAGIPITKGARETWKAQMKARPFLTSATTISALGGAGVIGHEVVNAQSPMTLEEAVMRDRRERQMFEIEGIKRREKRKRAMESLARLAALDPQLYNELTVGRALPRGAMVFGGNPRVDILEALASDMAEGRITAAPDPDQELQELFGAM